MVGHDRIVSQSRGLALVDDTALLDYCRIRRSFQCKARILLDKEDR